MRTLGRGADTDRPDELTRWRRAYLAWAGLDQEMAQTVAGDLRWDLHALLELLERGCPAPLAPHPGTGRRRGGLARMSHQPAVDAHAERVPAEEPADAAGPAAPNVPAPDVNQASAAWLSALRTSGPRHEQAVQSLHELLLRVAHSEMSHRRGCGRRAGIRVPRQTGSRHNAYLTDRKGRSDGWSTAEPLTELQARASEPRTCSSSSSNVTWVTLVVTSPAAARYDRARF